MYLKLKFLSKKKKAQIKNTSYNLSTDLNFFMACTQYIPMMPQTVESIIPIATLETEQESQIR
jgi:hypothetical protein